MLDTLLSVKLTGCPFGIVFSQRWHKGPLQHARDQPRHQGTRASGVFLSQWKGRHDPRHKTNPGAHSNLEGGEGGLDDGRGRAREDSVWNKREKRRWVNCCIYLGIAVYLRAGTCNQTDGLLLAAGCTKCGHEAGFSAAMSKTT
jgi:hypothetical protein